MAPLACVTITRLLMIVAAASLLGGGPAGVAAARLLAPAPQPKTPLRGLRQTGTAAGGRCGAPCWSRSYPGGYPCDSACQRLDLTAQAAGEPAPPALHPPPGVARRLGESRKARERQGGRHARAASGVPGASTHARPPSLRPGPPPQPWPAPGCLARAGGRTPLTVRRRSAPASALGPSGARSRALPPALAARPTPSANGWPPPQTRPSAPAAGPTLAAPRTQPPERAPR
jgi:hypothetical protein